MSDEPTPRPRRANTKALRRLREPIPPQNIGKKPRVYCWDCNLADEQRPGSTCEYHVARWCSTCRSTVSNAHDHVDYVGHAEATDRFLDADLQWNWRPMALDERGLPLFDDDGGMWIYLTIGGVERLGYGFAGGKRGGAAIKEVISDALKNSGMRFGVGLDQWAKTDLHAPEGESDQEHGAGEQPAPAAEPQHAHPDWIARVGSLLARKYGAYGEDRPRVLSKILLCEITDLAKLTPDQARDAVRILSAGPDLHPPTPAAATKPDPAAATPPTEPAPAADETPAQPERRAATPKRRKTTTPPASTTEPSPPATTPDEPGMGDVYARIISTLFDHRGIKERDTARRLEIVSAALRRPVGSMEELSKADAERVVDYLRPAERATPAEPEPPSVAAIREMIKKAASYEDAEAIKVEIGKALMADLITAAEAAALSDLLEKRGRQVGTP